MLTKERNYNFQVLLFVPLVLLMFKLKRELFKRFNLNFINFVCFVSSVLVYPFFIFIFK